MSYSQADVDGAFAQLTAQGYTASEANAYINGVLAAEQSQPAPASDPRLDEMYAHWKEARDLNAYDQMIANIVNDPANADVNPNRFHAFVAAAEGDVQKALGMYRENVNMVLTDFDVAQANAAEAERLELQRQEAAFARENPSAALHKRISDVGAAYAAEQRAKRGGY